LSLPLLLAITCDISEAWIELRRSAGGVSSEMDAVSIALARSEVAVAYKSMVEAVASRGNRSDEYAQRWY
jgi:ribosomal protein S9